MERVAKDVEAGDIFIINAERVASVMTEGDSTYLSWEGDGRAIDIVGSEEEVPDVLPWRCPSCRTPIVAIDWKHEEWRR